MAFDFDTVLDRSGTGSEKWMPYEGTDILPMWVADMDFASPPAIIEAMHRRVGHGNFGYAQPRPSVAEAVCEMCEQRYGWKIHPDWIVWLPGLVCGLNVTCRAFGDRGDAVLTSTPVYPPFLIAPKNMHREVITAPLVCREGRWTMDWEKLEESVTGRTRVFLLCHPHNPVGQVFSPSEIERLAEFCVRHDLVLCSDEIHCDLILDDIPHRPAATLHPEIADRTVTLMAPSKTYNIPGLGCSFAIVPNGGIRSKIRRAAAGIVPQVTIFGFEACEAAYRHCEPWRQELLAYLGKNRDLIWNFVQEELPELKTTWVEATYLAWFDVRSLGLNDPVKLFKEHGVALSDGRAFRGEGFVRLNFGCPRSILEEGLRRIRTAVEKQRSLQPTDQKE